MVMVLGANGILEPYQAAYDKRVAGVISGAGTYKPRIVLDKQQIFNQPPAHCSDGQSVMHGGCRLCGRSQRAIC